MILRVKISLFLKPKENETTRKMRNKIELLKTNKRKILIIKQNSQIACNFEHL